MRPDWKEIVCALRDSGISVNIITNGYLFSEKLIKDIIESDLESVSVSIDGPCEIHDKFRQKGSYERAIRAIDVLCQAGINTSAITTLNSENVKKLEELYIILCNYPIFAWQIQACSPMGNAAKCSIPVRFDFNEAIRFVSAHINKSHFAIGIADNIGYFTSEEGFMRGDKSGKSYFKGCSAGISSIGIDSIGNVRGCESMYDDKFIEGNLREKTLKHIWYSPDAFAYNRKFDSSKLTGSCKNCPYASWCAGGCRSYNYFMQGNLYESPSCARNKR